MLNLAENNLKIIKINILMNLWKDIKREIHNLKKKLNQMKITKTKTTYERNTDLDQITGHNSKEDQ